MANILFWWTIAKTLKKQETQKTQFMQFHFHRDTHRDTFFSELIFWTIILRTVANILFCCTIVTNLNKQETQKTQSHAAPMSHTHTLFSWPLFWTSKPTHTDTHIVNYTFEKQETWKTQVMQFHFHTHIQMHIYLCVSLCVCMYVCRYISVIVVLSKKQHHNQLVILILL